MYGHEYQTILPPETFCAAHRLQQKNGQKITFGEGASARSKTDIAATIVTMKLEVFLEPELVRGVLNHSRPRNKETHEGALNRVSLFYR